MDPVDSEKLAERLVSPDHIAGSEEGEVVIKHFLFAVIRIEGSDAAIAASGHVHTNNEVERRIEQFAFTYEAGPPSKRSVSNIPARKEMHRKNFLPLKKMSCLPTQTSM